MASKINTNSFFNRREGDKADIALQMASESFNISNALQAQFSSFSGKFSDFELDFEDSENFVQESFLDLQESFDKLSDTVKILSNDMSSLTDKFLLMEQKRADQLKEESIRIFEEQDAAQKQRKTIKAGSLLPGLGGGDSKDLSPGKGGGLGGLIQSLLLMKFGGPLLKKALAKGLLGGLGKKLVGKGATKGVAKGATKVATKKVAQEGLEVGAKKGTKAVTKKVAQEGGEQLVKAGVKTGVKKGLGKGIGKGLGKSVLKKLPGIGLLMGAGFAAHRAMKGDWSGAGLELASGAASTIPGLGTAASLAIDAGLVAKDVGAFGGGDNKKVDPDKLMDTEKGSSKRYSQEEYDKMNADYKANPTTSGAMRLNRYARKLKKQNKAEFGGTGEQFTLNDKTYQPGDEGYIESINEAQNVILGRVSNIENKIGIQSNKTDTIGDKDFVKEITAPPPNQDVLDAIEIAGTNTSSEQEEREPIPDTISGSTPVSSAKCEIGCVKSLTLNSVDNLNIG